VLHPDNDVEDCGVVTLDFESGFFASIDSSWSRPESFPTWGDVWLELVGTGGRIRIDPMATHLDLYSDTAGKLQHVGYSDDDMTLEMVRSFLDFARARAAGAEPISSPVSFDEGVHASDVVLAAYASVDSGRPEPVATR
jgi:predicted dehydrogenase